MRQDEADNQQGELAHVPAYLSQLPHCPACHHDILHYSSGWGVRICSLCAYVEGDKEYIHYPRPLPISEYLWLVGYAYTALIRREIDRDTFHDMVEDIAIYGGFYRPPGEK